MRKLVLALVLGGAILTVFTIYPLHLLQNSGLVYPSMTKPPADSPVAYDLVTVTVHDKTGKLRYQETTHNIVTGAGAIWFCIEQNRCTSQITGTTPSVPNVAAPTWWVQFITGTANTAEPTGADCTSPSGGGAITGQVSGGRCVTTFGALLSSAQYLTGGSIVTVSLNTGTAQLRTPSGNIDTANNFVQTTPGTVCTVTNTAGSSSTCQFSDTSPVMTNQSGGTLTINGLALASGTASTTVAGPLIIAEATLTTAITLLAGDTISVTWSVTT